MAESDAELVAATLEGNRESFEKIVARFQGFVFNIAYHYLGRREEVEDLAQEVFLKVFQTLDRYDTSRPLKHWIGKISVNRCLDELRKRKIRRLHLLSDLGDEDRRGIDQLIEASASSRPLTELEAERCLKLLEISLNSLPEKDRMAFVLREMEGQSYPELAAMLGISEVAARIRASRARKRLQEELEKLFHEHR
jgi:RNA polymerase sigma-70 factor (ECF subfamily)